LYDTENLIQTSLSEGKSPCCCYCKEKITEDAADYPICRLAANLQDDVKQLRQALANHDSATGAEL